MRREGLLFDHRQERPPPRRPGLGLPATMPTSTPCPAAPPWFVCVYAAAHRPASRFRHRCQPRAARAPAASSPVQPAPQLSLSSAAAPLLLRSVVLCCSVLEQPRAAIVADHHINARAVNRYAIPFP